MKFIGLFLLCVFLSSCELSRDSGVWRGEVSVDDGYTFSEQCQLEVEITRSSDTLILHSMNLGCPRYSYSWRVGAFDLFGGGIWKYGQRLGEVDPDGEVDLSLHSAVVDEPLPMAYRSIRLRWRRVGSELQIWQESEGLGRPGTVKGWLRRKR